MTQIYLARHGQDEDNAAGILNGRRDNKLTEIGRNQAKEVAQKIVAAGLTFDSIISSPLRRTTETASIIREAINGPEIESEELLIERDFGVMTGKPQNKILELCSPHVLQTEKVNYFLSPDEAETFPQLIKRGKKLLAKLEKKYPDEKILAVSHGDFGKMLYAAYYNLDWVEVLKMFHFGNSELILLSPNSAPEDVHIFQIQQFNS